ncbi:hypothetical protein EV213_112114 [Aureibacillus halotolerans]|uniref:Uncharacterized protein n=1 Tax=Aureibacillus halotolerans TaxID=1508390 RepID=A0A4R6U3X2_9BACI|nr:hypothetical protein EV213_112114 [Aureibacillus halotolerans]
MGPDLSIPMFWVWVTVMIVLSVWAVIGYYRKMYEFVSSNALFNVVNGDIMALFCLIPLWRVVGAHLWVGVVLLCLYFFCLVLIHVNRKMIFDGIYGKKRNSFGKIFLLLPFIIVGLSGGGSYGYSVSLQTSFGYDSSLVVMSALLGGFGFIFLVLFHCLWVKFEDNNN